MLKSRVACKIVGSAFLTIIGLYRDFFRANYLGLLVLSRENVLTEISILKSDRGIFL